jgi:putative component of toxin-antitoxin plasmid stabilization module
VVADDKKLIKLPSDVEVYKSSDGSAPFNRWLKKQKGHRCTAVETALDLVKRGTAVKVKGYTGNIGAIILVWPTKMRIYYGVDPNTRTIILLGGDEAGQTEDLVKAQDCWNDYKSRKATEVKNGKED